MFKELESKVWDSKSISSESVSSADIKVEMGTLHELTTPKLETQPLSATYPILDQPFKMNCVFLNLLAKFHGLLDEEPYCHINEFILICSTMKPEEITQGQIRLRTFPFSL